LVGIFPKDYEPLKEDFYKDLMSCRRANNDNTFIEVADSEQVARCNRVTSMLSYQIYSPQPNFLWLNYDNRISDVTGFIENKNNMPDLYPDR
jgi:hypothetical protein